MHSLMLERVSKDPKKREKANKRRQMQKEYLNPKVISAESKKPFELSKRDEFEDGDFDKILTEADKSRLIAAILERIMLADAPNTRNAFPKPQFAQDEEASLHQFFKRNDLLHEIVPLSSKARVIRAAREGHDNSRKSDI